MILQESGGTQALPRRRSVARRKHHVYSGSDEDEDVFDEHMEEGVTEDQADSASTETDGICG
jgi:hypothetical protein